MQYRLTSKRLPAPRYFASFYAAHQHAKALGFSRRQFQIEEV